MVEERPARDRHRDLVEIAGADFALVAGGGEAVRLGSEFRLLHLGIGAHAAIAIPAGQLEHRQVERVETRQRDELELVAHRSELALELLDRVRIEILAPVERGRAVIGQQLAGILRVDRLGEAARLVEIRPRRLPPQDVRRLGEGEAARDAVIDAGAFLEAVETLRRAAVGLDEGAVALIDIGGDQPGRFRIGAAHDHGGHAHHVGGEARSIQIALMRSGWGMRTLPPRCPHFFSEAS